MGRPGSGQLASTLAAILLGVALAVNGPAGAYHPEEGRPLLQDYPPMSYGAGTQNWAVLEAPTGLVYVGNNDGVLEFDGARWRLIRLSNLQIARSLALATDGTIYVGGLGDLGYLEPDANGRQRFVSLKDRLPASVGDFEDIWRTHVTDLGVIFQTRDGIFRLREDGQFDVWPIPSEFRIASFWADGTLWVQRREQGLLRWAEGQWQRVSEHPALKLTPLDGVVEHPSGLVLATRDQGLLLLREGEVAEFATEAQDLLRASNIYRAGRLPSGEISLATLNSGLVLLDDEGRLLRIVNSELGLRDQTVYAFEADRRGGLWLGLSNGIARVEIPSPITVFDADTGFDGFPQVMIRHQGRLWIGHTRGLGVIEPAPDRGAEARWRPVSGLDGQTGGIAVFEGRLLVTSVMGSLHGVWEVRDEEAVLVRESADHSTILLPSTIDPRRVWVGLNDGLASMRREDDGWHDEGRISGIDVSARTLVEDAEGHLWMGTEAFGVFRVSRSPGGEPQVRHYTQSEGLSPASCYLYPVGDELLVATIHGLRRYDPVADRFVPDTRFGERYADGTRNILYLNDQGEDGVWINSSNASGVSLDHAIGDGRGRFTIVPTPLRRIESMLVADQESTMYVEPGGVFWVGSSAGMIRYDPAVDWAADKSFTTLIRRVATGEGGERFGGHPGVRSGHAIPELPNQPDFVRFEFAPLVFESPAAIRYQYQLEGLESQWSDWTSESSRIYNGLAGGAYRFRVRARDVLGQIGAEDRYAFIVRPAWYQTLPAMIAAVLALAGLVWSAAYWQSRRLRAQTRRLEALVAERTRELVDANLRLEIAATTDLLTGLPNRRAFVKRFEQEESRANRGHGAFAVCLGDIDDFKTLNDTHGHEFGDAVLRAVAEALRGSLRSHDFVARWGGEEFALMLPCTTTKAAVTVADKLREAVATPIHDDEGGTVVPTMTLGVAVYDPGLSLNQLLHRADLALYRGKEAGKNRTVAWSSELMSAL